ncbi:MAG TPA: MaoC family dehydratase [Gaiellaceae bacterium]|nr:MaoC family dehydratase [Gaiellaceae bacterium]
MNVGDEFGPSEWLEIDQERINRFAEATDDPQWIHVDVERAAEGPFGTTIAHGFLTLSLLVRFWNEVSPVFEGYRMGINYGVNKVRFPSPVPVGSRVRGRFTVAAIDEIENGIQVTLSALAEREGQEKPVCAAELVFRQYR